MKNRNIEDLPVQTTAQNADVTTCLNNGADVQNVNIASLSNYTTKNLIDRVNIIKSKNAKLDIAISKMAGLRGVVPVKNDKEINIEDNDSGHAIHDYFVKLANDYIFKTWGKKFDLPVGSLRFPTFSPAVAIISRGGTGRPYFYRFNNPNFNFLTGNVSIQNDADVFTADEYNRPVSYSFQPNLDEPTFFQKTVQANFTNFSPPAFLPNFDDMGEQVVYYRFISTGGLGLDCLGKVISVFASDTKIQMYYTRNLTAGYIKILEL